MSQSDFNDQYYFSNADKHALSDNCAAPDPQTIPSWLKDPMGRPCCRYFNQCPQCSGFGFSFVNMQGSPLHCSDCDKTWDPYRGECQHIVDDRNSDDDYEDDEDD